MDQQQLRIITGFSQARGLSYSYSLNALSVERYWRLNNLSTNLGMKVQDFLSFIPPLSGIIIYAKQVLLTTDPVYLQPNFKQWIDNDHHLVITVYSRTTWFVACYVPGQWVGYEIDIEGDRFDFVQGTTNPGIFDAPPQEFHLQHQPVPRVNRHQFCASPLINSLLQPPPVFNYQRSTISRQQTVFALKNMIKCFKIWKRKVLDKRRERRLLAAYHRSIILEGVFISLKVSEQFEAERRIKLEKRMRQMIEESEKIARLKLRVSSSSLVRVRSERSEDDDDFMMNRPPKRPKQCPFE